MGDTEREGGLFCDPFQHGIESKKSAFCLI
jgi:hypothetical protein